MTDTVTPRGPRGPRLRRVLGLPVTRGHGRFITGNLIDSLGNGMLLPLGLLYFTTLRDLPLAAVGAALTVGQPAALPVVFVAGRFMDRHGPKHLTVTANVVSAAGFLSFLLAERPWQIAGAYLLVQSGINAYCTAQRTLLLHAAPASQTRSWFAFTGSLRNIGIGVGALLATGALALFGTHALTWLVVTAAPLYLLAAFCFARVPTNPPPDTATAGTTSLLKRQADAMGEQARVVAAYDGPRMTGFCLYYHQGSTTWLRAVGIDPERPAPFAYFALTYYAPIEDAYRHGTTALHAGMKAMAAKRLRGARVSGLYALHDTRTGATPVSTTSASYEMDPVRPRP
jgi:hypothetical protein